jgi:5'-nucleotidase / UDP-sugar diphosphatase
MRKIYTFLLLTLIGSASYSQAGKKIVILHTNDMHSRVTGFGPESAYTPLSVNDDKTIGGFARIAAIIRSEKEKLPENTLAIDAGDFLMGTLFHTVEAETGFQLPLMKKMGYDIVSLGNHEFDFGTSKLTEIVRSSLKRGALPEILLSNAVFSKKDKGDDSLEELYSEDIIKRSLVLTRDGIKIGFFALLGINAADVAPYASPLTFEKQTAYAEKAVKELKKQKCDMIICLSHSGLTKGSNGAWEGEDVDLAKKVDGLTLIISGHTHTKLEKPLVINGIPIIQAGEYGEFVGKIVLSPDSISFKYKMESYELIPVNDKIQGNAEINELVERQKINITGYILEPFGLDYNKPVTETNSILECNEQGNLEESNLAPLVADAINYYLNKHSSKGADVSMVSAGVIRDKMMPGIQSVPDLFRIMPLGSGKDKVPGYAFSRLYVTGRELKNIIEILLVAHKSNTDYFCYYSGLKVMYNPRKGLLKKINKISLVKPGKDDEEIDLSKGNKTLYSVTANSYMLEFIGIIRKKTMGMVNVVPKDSEGKRVTDMKTAIVDVNEEMAGVQEGKEWLALLEYLSQMKDLNGNGIPDLEPKYYLPVRVLLPSLGTIKNIVAK